MHKLVDYICDELEDLEMKVEHGGRLSMQEIEYMDTLAHAKKNLLKAEGMGDYSMDEMSMRGGSYRGGSYRGANQYGSYDGGSYNRGRSYSRARRGGRYSRAASDNLVGELREMMNEAPNDQAKQEFQKFIDKMESM